MVLTLPATIVVVAVLFLATLIRSAFGFGEALVAVPLLALVLPVEVAAPLAVLVSITVAFIVLMQDWRHVHVRSAGWLVLSTIVGIPIGLLLLTRVAEPIVKAALAIMIMVFSIYSLVSGARRSRFEFRDDRYAWFFGFSAGILGGAYGMNGPPLVVYASLRKWSPEHFRATLQGYFLPASVLGICGYWFAGLWTPTVTRLFLLSLPTVILATFFGRLITSRMNTQQFLFYVHVMLIVIGIILLFQAGIGETLP